MWREQARERAKMREELHCIALCILIQLLDVRCFLLFLLSSLSLLISHTISLARAGESELISLFVLYLCPKSASESGKNRGRLAALLTLSAMVQDTIRRLIKTIWAGGESELWWGIERQFESPVQSAHKNTETEQTTVASCFACLIMMQFQEHSSLLLLHVFNERLLVDNEADENLDETRSRMGPVVDRSKVRLWA